MSKLDQIRDLMELACGASEEEARSAALLACKLAKKHGYILMEAPAHSHSHAQTSERPVPPARTRRKVSLKVPVDVQDIVSNAAGDVITSVLRSALRGR